MHTDLFIGNEYVAAAGHGRFDVINPATEDVLADVALGDVADVDNAVRRARACFISDEWQGMSTPEARDDPGPRGRPAPGAAG